MFIIHTPLRCGVPIIGYLHSGQSTLICQWDRLLFFFQWRLGDSVSPPLCHRSVIGWYVAILAGLMPDCSGQRGQLAQLGRAIKCATLIGWKRIALWTGSCMSWRDPKTQWELCSVLRLSSERSCNDHWEYSGGFCVDLVKQKGEKGQKLGECGRKCRIQKGEE